MKKMFLACFCSLFFKSAVSMDRSSLDPIVVQEQLDSFVALQQAFEKYNDSNDFLSSCIVLPHALAEYLICNEGGHQCVDEKAAIRFGDLSKNHPHYYQQCINDLVQEVYQRKEDKSYDTVIDIQQKFRKNIVDALYQTKGEISQIIPEYEKQRKNYIHYAVKTTVFSMISLVGVAGISYFSWMLYRCYEN